MGRYERQIVNAFDETAEWAAMRAPASGGATDRSLPDFIASRPVSFTGLTWPVSTLANAYVGELKATKSNVAYAEVEEVTALVDFADRFGATPVLAAKFKRPGGSRSRFWIVRTENVRRTDSGTYALDESDIEKRAEMVVYPSTESSSAAVEVLDDV